MRRHAGHEVNARWREIPGDHPSQASGRDASALTETEQAVAVPLLDGQLNEQIAARRGTSTRTIATQLVALFAGSASGRGPSSSRASIVAKVGAAAARAVRRTPAAHRRAVRVA